MKTRKTYKQVIDEQNRLYLEHCTPIQQAYDWSMPVLYTPSFSLRMTIVCLLDSLYWELDTLHTNADKLMQDCIDNAFKYSDSVY